MGEEKKERRKHLHLDERLAAIAGLVREGKVVADVGCDHAYLVCHLVANRICPRAFACDIAPGPLSRARQNICREGLEARILTVQCAGLEAIDPDAVDDIVVAGLGGDIIAEIVTSWKGCRNKDKLFILQPMTKPEHLRRELFRAGFMVSEEMAVLCSGFVYVILCARYSGIPMEISCHQAYTGHLWHKDPCDEATLAYLSGVHEYVHTKAHGMSQAREQAAETAEFLALAATLEDRIRRERERFGHDRKGHLPEAR